MEDARKRELLAEIVALTAPPAPVAEDEFTIRDYVEATGLGQSASQRRLDHLVEQGVLVVRPATNAQGHPCRAYRKV